MNILDYRCTEDNGLSFELIVDGQLLGDLIGSRDRAFPSWIVEDDLPYDPPYSKEHDPELRIVTVCSCGEYGCGCSKCRVIRVGEAVVFQEFEGDVSAEGAQKAFQFSRANYDSVVKAIVERARASLRGS
ncbi:MAG TPA: hypothetical protein VGF55_22620 [Gemmataceae bacterium]|jgi:hypothetical protein